MSDSRERERVREGVHVAAACRLGISVYCGGEKLMLHQLMMKRGIYYIRHHFK